MSEQPGRPAPGPVERPAPPSRLLGEPGAVERPAPPSRLLGEPGAVESWDERPESEAQVRDRYLAERPPHHGD